MINLLLIISALMLAGHFKGRMDAYTDTGIKTNDWPNKYDFTKPGNKKHWWYFGLYTPKFPEKFPFSTTMLVFLTDRWHEAQFFMLRSFYVAVSLAVTSSFWWGLILTFVVFPMIVGLFFEVSYQTKKEEILNENTNKNNIPSGDGPNDNSQVTSVPEKQIGD
jgi:hypothetical protein